MADSSPKEIGGLSGGLFNTFGNISVITTQIIIGYLISGTGSFNGALIFVGANAIVAMLSYLFIGEIKRVELKVPAKLQRLENEEKKKLTIFIIKWLASFNFCGRACKDR
jgi:nitrate/nitrite transporter NarK